MSAERVFADGLPPKRPIVFRELLRTIGASPYRAVVTGTRLLCAQTHWVNNRTLPHVEGDCPTCRLVKNQRWYGWVSAIGRSGRTGKDVHGVLQLTENAARQAERVAIELGGLRRCYVQLQRAKGGDQQRVDFTLLSTDWPHSVPEGFDVRPTLLNIWGVYVAFCIGEPGGPTLAQPPTEEQQQ